MPRPRKKRKKATTKVSSIGDVSARVSRIRHDVEGAVDTLRKRAVKALPPGQRKQVDEVFDRIGSVSHDVNKTVEQWRADIEKRFRVIRGTVDKRVTKIRKRTISEGRSLLSGLEADVRGYVETVFKRMQLPVHGDIESIKRRLSMIERRLGALEKAERRAA